MSALLEVDCLHVRLRVEDRLQTVLHEVSLEVGEGEAVGLVGESGSGKSMTARAVARLLPPGAAVEGRVTFAGADVLSLREKALRSYRTGGVAMIFQDPRAHINPVRTIGDFLTEGMRTNAGVRAPVARRRAVDLLDQVGIEDGERRLRQYPHQLSGGLLQRVMIASVLASEPQLVLADEPTTALDVTTQSEVMAILDRLRRDRGMAMLFITHDLELAGAVCDRTAVMYAGSIVEQQASATLHRSPRHPYTAALLGARPDITCTAPRLQAVPGNPLSAFEAPPGCAFAPRCSFVQDRCREAIPPLAPAGPGVARCVRSDELAETLAAGPARSGAEGVR
jgi:oligopeptide/dipeptide ABC transporter ATP-binding protein